MSEKKKQDDAAQIFDEDLNDASGGVLKSGDVTLKRGTFNTVERSDPSTLTSV